LNKAGGQSFVRVFIMTGLLGGFTTFSAFSLEVVALLKEGLIGSALAYVFISILEGLLATFWALKLP